MLRHWIAPIVVAFAAAACSAAPPSEAESHSSSNVSVAAPCPAPNFQLMDSNAVTWVPGTAVAGEVAHIVDDIYGDANWAVVDPVSHTIKYVLAVDSTYRAQFLDSVVYLQKAGYCEAYGWFSGESPCHPTGGGSDCKTYYYSKTDPSAPSDGNASLCLYTAIATHVLPACEASCRPAACGECGTIFDGCGKVLNCGSCSSGLSCIGNQCVNAHCRTGYRWCGVDQGCVKGSVCP